MALRLCVLLSPVSISSSVSLFVSLPREVYLELFRKIEQGLEPDPRDKCNVGLKTISAQVHSTRDVRSFSPFVGIAFVGSFSRGLLRQPWHRSLTPLSNKLKPGNFSIDSVCNNSDSIVWSCQLKCFHETYSMLLNKYFKVHVSDYNDQTKTPVYI